MLMALFLIGSWILTYMFHNHLGIGTVFTHLFYAPIILASLWWGKKGVFVAALYGLMLIISHIFVREAVETNNDYLRSIIFILVSIFVATLSETIKHREQTLKNQSQDLSERIRELRCLLDLSAFWKNNDRPVSEMLQAVVERLPSSFRYPEIACSRLFFKGEAFQTANFKETRWKLSATILIQDRSVGLLEVCYLSKKPELRNGPFLNEEKELIDAIAVWLGDIIENIIARQARQRITRQMKTLAAFRQIKQLITRERNSEKLASLACAMLTETWGYDYSWICLVNESGRIDHHAESGLGKAFSPFIRAIASGELPNNVKTALDRPGRVVTTQSAIESIAPLAATDADMGTMTVALTHDKKVYGLLSVAIQKDLIDDDSEHRLFKELASDIAFALQNSVVAKQQTRIKKELKEKEQRYRLLFNSSSDPIAVHHLKDDLFQANFIETTPIATQLPGYEEKESSLKQSEKRYSALIKNSPDIIYILDGNGRFVFVGGALEPLLGYKPSELIGANISSIVWPVDLESNFWYLRERRTGNRVTKKVELRLEVKRNKAEPGVRECIIVELNSHGLYEKRSPNGHRLHLGTYGVARDITHRRHTETALQKSEEKFRILVENAPFGLAIVNRTNTLDYVNHKFSKITGFTLHDITDLSALIPAQTLDEKNQQRNFNAWTNNFETQDFISTPFTIHSKKQTPKTINFKGVRLEDKRLLVTLEDITAQHQMQKQLKQSKLTLQAVFDGLPDSLLMLDKEMNITMVNTAAITHYSIAPDHVAETLHTPCYKGLLKRFSPCDHCRIVTAVQQEKHAVFERNNPIFPDRYEQVTTFPLGKKDGPNINTLVYIRDITEKKRIEEQMFRADRLSSLGQLSGGIAHEIRNPLSGIRLYVDLLLNSPQCMRTDKEIEILNEIKDGVIKINKIIKGILDFAKAPLKPQKQVNINVTIKNVLKLWTPIIKKSGINLDLNLHHPMEPVFGETVQLNQIINNLLSNAVDAMASDDTLSISTTMGPSTLIPDRTVVFLRIEDTGCGIAEENRTSIFNPFFTTKPMGTGLGLAITHKIIERHGGIITIDSTPGQGTSVVIELPLTTPLPAMDPPLLSG
jgi:PAS domain S-box-containing protein